MGTNTRTAPRPRYYVFATWGGRMQWRSLNHTLERALRDARYEQREGRADAYVEHADTGERWAPNGSPMLRAKLGA